MIDYLYQTSDLNLFLILSTILIGISMAALFLIRAFFPFHLRYQEDQVIGCTSALIIVIYGLLAGFATSYLITNNNTASAAIEQEANAITNLYRDAQLLTGSTNQKIQVDLKNYLNEVLDQEWPLMSQGKTIPFDGNNLIKQLASDIAAYKTSSPAMLNQLAAMQTLTQTLYDARQQRIELSYVSLSNEIWVVIIIGTLLSLCVSYLFGVNFYLHIFIVVAAAIMSVCIMFLLISLDKPFQGESVIGSGALKTTREYINLATPI